jgi:outer membrane immunogenic protein
MRCLPAALFAALLAALGLTGLHNPALAADYELPTLRGSSMFVPAYPTYFSWQGLYAGGQLSYTSASADFTRASAPLIAFSLQQLAVLNVMAPDQWSILGTSSTGAGGLGGFVGYNVQWDKAVVGLELNYTHSSVSLVAPSTPLAREGVVGALIDDVTVDASASMHISDFATTRARLGWAIDHFMPYGTLGVAVGRADVAVSTNVTVVEKDPSKPVNNPNPPPATLPLVIGTFVFPNSQSKNGAFMYGWSGGAGLDFAMTQNIFARGEYEYIQWGRFWSIAPSMHNFRFALGVKF